MCPILLSLALLGQAAPNWDQEVQKVAPPAAKLYGPDVPERGILTLNTGRAA
jgi:hypothetical protein